MKRLFLHALIVLCAPTLAQAREPIRLANHPALSPDGLTLAFDWNGDIWTVSSNGGQARQMTMHAARDRQPKFAPDGKSIAFVSDRDGSNQVYVMPVHGGEARQTTFHTAGYTLHGWTTDGNRLLVSSMRDHFWRHAERFFFVNAHQRAPEQMLFDDYGSDGSLSPDGQRLLFTREGPQWWRKSYKGSQASQVWQWNLESKEFMQAATHETGCLWPMWRPDGRGFYYVSGQSGSFNLWERDADRKQDQQLTRYNDDSVAFPCISRDGTAIVFRHLFDFYKLTPGSAEPPRRLDIYAESDRPRDHIERRVLQSATQAAFSNDGLEIAMVVGGDLWVMDTELREPKQITHTPGEERFPVWSSDGESILFVSDDSDAKCDLWKATRSEKSKFWWLNENFTLERLTQDGEVKSNLKLSPDGSRLGFVRGRGELWVGDTTGKNLKRLVASFTSVEFDWSPDGKWIVYSKDDNDFNRDVFVIPADGSKAAFNLSRHPRNDSNPVWSPDGKFIAFTGERGEERDIMIVYLRADDAERSARDRFLEKALEKMKSRKTATPAAPKESSATPPKVANVRIDFEGIHDRIRRVNNPDMTETSLFWSPDGKKLAFIAAGGGRSGTYTIDVPDDLQPKLLTEQTGTQPRWLNRGNQIVWLAFGVPTSVSAGGGAPTASPVSPRPTSPGTRGGGAGSASSASGGSYRFSAAQTVDTPSKHAAVFDLAWRTMRDNWYDEKLNNRDWNQIRTKYRGMAEAAPDTETLGVVVNMMLGELNGSHLGFFAGIRDITQRRPPGQVEDPPAGRWRVVTANLGIRFVDGFAGPGLKVRDVIQGSPADQQKSKIRPGEIVTAVDGVAVGPTTDMTLVLNGPMDRDIKVSAKAADGKERSVVLRPISYVEVRRLLYEQWLADNRSTVDKLSKGALGYLHIAAMDMTSFVKFEEQLYAAGAGKDGLVIDVRENGGGSTADHLLTALTQPVHAITVGRGGGPGYPQDRTVYATWNKPIVVLCNQNSFSNAEIFSHAIKTLKRGQLVGVPTAGGVISTGGVAIMDLGFLRLPFRGWFLINDGQDMELNGAVPHHVVWPQPTQMPAGKDVQLEKGVEVLLADVKAWKSRPQPKLIKASERN